MPCGDSKNCKPVMIAKFRLKTDHDNYDAVGPGGMTSLRQTMDMLRKNKNFLQQALAMDNWFAFAPNGKDDRILNPSRYVILAKVICMCDLLIWMDTEDIAWFEQEEGPQALHHYAITHPEVNLGTLYCQKLFTFRI